MIAAKEFDVDPRQLKKRDVIPPGASLEDEYGNLDKQELVSQKIALNRRCICRC
jgi:hypothetical protein